MIDVLRELPPVQGAPCAAGQTVPGSQTNRAAGRVKDRFPRPVSAD
jgi:hypothetical protein